MVARYKTPFEIPLAGRPKGTTLSTWLYHELRKAILVGRLRPGTRLPSTRDFAHQHQISRGTVVTVFEQLEAEGMLDGRKGVGTWVKNLQSISAGARQSDPAKITLPTPFAGLRFPHPTPAFRSYEPALSEFPIDIWSRLTSKRLRSATPGMLGHRDARGFSKLREAIADYLGVSRGVRCSAEQIVIVSGTQQALDILARVLFRLGDTVWMEDPGYFGAVSAFFNAGLECIPVEIDREGFRVVQARKVAPKAKGVYLTPGHQFPLGVVMSMQRRLEVLSWARATGAFVIEDDYDGPYRLTGAPVPSLFSLDQNESVILIGSFNKVLGPTLRTGYMVLPERLVETVTAFRFNLDLNAVGVDHMVLADFIEGGYLGRHIRRTRDLYAERLGIMRETGRKYLDGLMDIVPVQTGLHTTGLLKGNLTGQQAEDRARQAGVETLSLSRFKIKYSAPEGLLLGFAPFDRKAIVDGLQKLEKALKPASHRANRKRVHSQTR